MDENSWVGAAGDTGYDMVTVVERFITGLRDGGVPLDRVTIGIPLLHPQIASSGVQWETGSTAAERRYPMNPETLERLRNSPLYDCYTKGTPYRGLEDRGTDYPILADLRRDGFTDYLVVPLAFSDGTHKALTCASKAPGGFVPDQVAQIEAAAGKLAPALEIVTLRRTATTLLDTYVGPSAGRKVWQGQIRRGHLDTIRAVIWFSDLRGFTALSERLAGDETVTLLNAYFGAAVDAVTRGGGEVLKFIGDAVLAIFPLTGDDQNTVARALGAAREAQAAFAAARAAGQPIEVGVGLHLGDVLYGNIGGAARLDFTVIGPAVNFASRIEGLCAQLREPILLSADVAALAGDALQSAGTFDLKGVAGRHAVYRPGIPKT